MVSYHLNFTAWAVIITIFSTASAHMIMSSPAPYGKSTLDNSPLLADGSDFPCKQRTGVYDAEGAANNLVIGQSNTLSFIGSAVHGGGSCQVSLTTDLEPTKDTKWMVIKSIEGNCPSNVTGNLEENAAGTGAATFQYTVPAGIAPGQYTIAWSWVNKVGNREFYMNCGPATISAATKKRYAPEQKVRRQSSFPDLFVANLAGVSNGCSTPETFDILYPDPGADVQTGSIGVQFTTPAGCTAGGANAPAATPTASGSANASSGAFSSVVASSVPTSAASPIAPSVTSADPGSFATGAAPSQASGAVSTVIVSPIPVASTASALIPASSSAPATSPPTTAAGAQSGACTDEGAWACSADGTSFQRCASGTWSVVLEMSAGTTCTPGISDTLTMEAGKVKRTGHARRVMNRLFG